MPSDIAPIRASSEVDERQIDLMPYHQYARTHEPNWVYNLVRLFLVPFTLSVYRLRVRGIKNVPKTGPVILAPNHGSFLDHFLVAALLRRKVRFAGKSQIFGHSLGDKIFVPGGVFPVARGMRDGEMFVTAAKILENDGIIGFYVEGGRSRDGEIAAKAKTGIGRLMLETGATVVPVAVHNSHRVRNWRRGELPSITVSFGQPIQRNRLREATRDQQREAAAAVLEAIRTEHSALSNFLSDLPWWLRMIAR